jgi:hypothetical protein
VYVERDEYRGGNKSRTIDGREWNEYPSEKG